MIKTRINNEYKDVVKIFGGGTLQKEIVKVWSREAQEYVYESSVEYTGALPITISANGDVLIDYRIYGADGGVGEPTENLFNISRERSDIFTLDSKYYIYGGNAVNKNVSSSNIHIVVTDKLEVSSNSGSGAGFIIPVLPNTTYTLSYDIDLSLSDSTTSAVLNFIDNDERFGTYWGIYGNITKNTFTTESTTKYVYIIFRTVFRTVTYSNIILVEGSTPPPSYIPYGYKLPMTVYKQEFEVTSDMLDQSNWILSGYWFMYFDISDFISKAECDAKIYENFADGYTPQLLAVAITDKKYSMVDDSYRILKNNGEILDKKFDFSSWDKIYLCIGYGKGFSTEEDKQLKIDELFGNWKILIAPTSQTREAPVYIGENKLGAGEYVSYIEQKIYRDVGGTLTPTDPPVPLPQVPTIDGTTIIDYNGDPKPSQMYVKYRR